MKPVGQETSKGEGMDEEYIGIEDVDFGSRAGGNAVSGVMALRTREVLEKVVYERPWPKG